MKITGLTLENFRNYETAELKLTPGVTLILGRNGQGKTNLVEAINYPIELGSHRSPRDDALIKAGAESAIIRLTVEIPDRTLGVDFQINRGKPNRVQVNLKSTNNREVSRFYRSVLFAPEDLSVVRGEPAGRRAFIDEILVQSFPRYAEIISSYDRVLKQRNTLLKSVRSRNMTTAPETLQLWTEQLVDFGSQLILGRLHLIQKLTPLLKEKYQFLVDNDHQPVIALESSLTGEKMFDSFLDQFLDSSVALATVKKMFHVKLSDVERQELERGLTLAGPHRDDIFFGLNTLPVRGYASHGESWSFALSLRLAEAEILRRDSISGDPIILLDDVFAELDKSRREKLASSIADYEQVIITAAVAEDIPDDFRAHTVTIHAGRIVDQ